MSSNVAVCLAE